ncbi:MAG: UDP-N-acetylmuramate--L-alanine ligase [Bacteroidales bacterium]|nr:UDP-N-acetylmuramate--L-alanine ligase [Bacteroidales bacterium]
MKLSLENIGIIYFLGIGGIGMSALARYFKAKGKIIHGYDKTPTALTSELQQEGMQLHFKDDPGLIHAETSLVIYTPAIPKNLQEFLKLQNSGIPMLKRSEALGMITEGKMTIAVAGTHGKTSISSMIAHILMQAGMPVTALIGGISKNYLSNFITSSEEEIMVVEADEFDRSFLQLHPDIAVISSMDPDHLDIYGSGKEMKDAFTSFAHNIKPNGKIIIHSDLPIRIKPDTLRINYGSGEGSDIFAVNPRIKNGLQVFDIMGNELSWKGAGLQIPGLHNIENTLAAVAVCRAVGLDREKIIEGIRSYTGVRRRFDIRINTPEVIYIDDYAHHPRELEAFITAVREFCPGKMLTGIFQPHLYSRTRDFAEGFAESLDLLDEVWLLDIYPARELPIPGVSSEIIFDRIRNERKKRAGTQDVIRWLNKDKPQVLMTMGAGDIDQLVEPIEKILKA